MLSSVVANASHSVGTRNDSSVRSLWSLLSPWKPRSRPDLAAARWSDTTVTANGMRHRNSPGAGD